MKQWAAAAVAPVGPATVAAMLLGATACIWLPQLPPLTLLWPGLALSALLLWIPRLRLAGAALLGATLLMLHASHALTQRLPETLQGVDLQLQVQVRGLPELRPGVVRFEAEVIGADGAAEVLQGAQVRLGWYGADAAPAPGSRWQLTVRMKRPRGVQNPGGFDFERYALERRIAATGYVREHPDNRELHGSGGIGALRLLVSERISAAVPRPEERFLRALAVADQRGLDGADWEVLRATGTAHLIAISGLHVGMVAGFGALLMRLLFRLWPGLGLRMPLPQAAAVAALLLAFGYAAMAGFALPTLRSVCMLAAALLATLLRRAHSPTQSFALAALVILLLDPLALLGASFWLSFLGVAWLLFCLPGHGAQQPLWRTLLSVQGVATVALLPMTLWFFGQASLVGALANLLAVPWITFVVVPLTLVGTLLLGASEWLAAAVLQLAAWLLTPLWALLRHTAAWPPAQFFVAEPTLPAFLLSLLAIFWLLLPRGVPGKPLAALLFLPLLLPPVETLAEGELDLHLLDVGQGLSVLLRTRDENLLYDAGPSFAGGLDMGEAAVVPALRGLGVRRLDRIIIGHADNDHAGGAEAVMRAFPGARVQASRSADYPAAETCVAGTGWRSGGVQFELLHPTPHFPYLGNDSSCVLRVETAAGALLVTGDIGEIIETRLLRDSPDQLPARVLLVPHHGSASSSSQRFIDAVDPEVALIGVGHRNRFGLPRDAVLQRYRDAGTVLFDTASGGAIRLRFLSEGSLQVTARRTQTPRFWHETAAAP